MGLLAWLFGKKEQPITGSRPEKHEAISPGKDQPLRAAPSQKSQSAPAAKATLTASRRAEKQEAPLSEAENLRRWRTSGQARSWIEAHHGHWNHADWLSLLEALQRSPFWPLRPEDVGKVLEELRGQWQQGQ